MSEVKKSIFLILGVLFTLLGFIGVLLPIIPGIPFFLIGLLFLAKGSRKFTKLLLRNQQIRKNIKKIRKEGLNKRVRNITLIGIWITHVTSIIFIKILAVKIVLFMSLIFVTAILLTMKTKQNIFNAQKTIKI